MRPRRWSKSKKSALNSTDAPSEAPAPAPRIIPRSEHTVSRSGISPNALRVLHRLREGGFQAFLVGGCVRDLLLGMEPKDFDVATDALPEQVKRLFRNCRLVGRRFRLAHVFFGQEIIEVATFRAASAPSQGEEPLADADPEDGEAPELAADGAEEEASDPGEATPVRAFAQEARPTIDDDSERMFDATGRILRDNVYGTIDEDVWRRDFTANSLYYNIADFSIWDYVGGVEDARTRTLKLIGDPETRYHEDAVRMLRAVRFAAKLDFSIAPATAEPISRLAGMLDGIPPARLFDEVCKLFLAGFAERAFDLLIHYRLLEHLLPSAARAMAQQPSSNAVRLLRLGLQGTDSRV